jgi:hypothetical protein
LCACVYAGNFSANGGGEKGINISRGSVSGGAGAVRGGGSFASGGCVSPGKDGGAFAEDRGGAPSRGEAGGRDVLKGGGRGGAVSGVLKRGGGVGGVGGGKGAAGKLAVKKPNFSQGPQVGLSI